MSRYDRQLYAAKIAYDNQSPPEPDWDRDDFIEEFITNPANVKEAVEWTDGEMSSDHYDATQAALYALHTTHPADLIGSDVLAKLYALAKERATLVDARLERLAEQAWDAQERAA